MKQLIAFIICLFVFSGIAKSDNNRPISVNELPKKSQDFIQQFFPGNAIAYSKMEKEFRDKNYDVVLANGEKIEFDKNGEWKEVDCKFSAVPDAIVPKQIKDYLAQQFPQAKVLKIERETKGYEVKLDNQLEIKFNPRFQVIEIDD
ncbi:MAG: PepSY-like domain-containing protein [Odoribacter sp.]|nr:PepSY-like domain-containing protein [Odoribacter sp.]